MNQATPTQRKELKDRVEAKRMRLQAKLAELKAEGRKESRETIEQLETKLDELRGMLREGWDRVSEPAAAKLNEWLSDDDDDDDELTS